MNPGMAARTPNFRAYIKTKSGLEQEFHNIEELMQIKFSNIHEINSDSRILKKEHQVYNGCNDIINLIIGSA